MISDRWADSRAAQRDLDSMDYLRFLAALSARYHVEIPEADVATLRTIDELAAYLAARRG